MRTADIYALEVYLYVCLCCVTSEEQKSTIELLYNRICLRYLRVQMRCCLSFFLLFLIYYNFSRFMLRKVVTIWV